VGFRDDEIVKMLDAGTQLMASLPHLASTQAQSSCKEARILQWGRLQKQVRALGAARIQPDGLLCGHNDP